MNVIISNSSDSPIYEQIVSQIKGQIIQGQLKAGEALPSIRNLAKELNISVITTKRAYEELEKEGFIETIRGKGSYVSSQNKEFIREQKMKEIELKLVEIIKESKMLGLNKEELFEILKLLYEE
ncbi:GntR family transcriptional regulator [Hathewaya limosa]|uniref:GntR family transcriptional regulator n=1 Tax=Hathewaya limosa TaxID=1536 RepID=A0ABU0JV33_HATLI|nr:GntR family transcriptional regulator [Hathewaya limosa]AWZ47481.1 GntR family transcriptional regulator [Clostridiaceae bacterium 14S0207]MDQ0480071.1 GntR family transcriptional regulator [Hathewaya limosa]